MIVTTEIEGGIATVTLNRPEKKNAMNCEMLEALPEAASALSAERAVILTGYGAIATAVAAVCLGAGFQLALGADFRIAHPEAKLSIMEARWGLIPDMGITQSLPKLMRADQAKMLMMTARSFSGVDAAEMGLVTEVSETPLARARALAELLAHQSPDALAGAKRLTEEGWGGGRAALALEAELQAALLGSPNQIEAVMANMQKRAPKFGSA